MRPRLALLFLFALATIYPVPSCRYKTYAQESGDIVGAYGSDANAGISLLAEGDVGYETLDDLIRTKSGDGYTFLKDYERFRYDYFLKDIPDDDGYDSWYYYGCMIAKATASSGLSNWYRFVFYGELYKINGVWVAKKWFISFGLPGYTGTNDYGMTYAEGQNFFAQYVACLEKYCELTKQEFNSSGQYDNYINYETYDSDKGGVNNLAEWIRGTSNNDIFDDNHQGGNCVCGACCECKCLCGKWSALTCNGTAIDCDCHAQGPDCTCASYCCACKCECKKCADGTHSAHENGSDVCDGGDDDTIGFDGCDCHKVEEPETDCTCAKYCCKHTCKCEKCGDGECSAHENGSATCDNTDGESGCSCHKTDDPENPDEEECTCSNYCCLHTCECAKCGVGEHSAHGNGLPTCNGTTENTGCACHETTGDDEECTCANYCCYHTCECKRCASFSAEKHSQHKNGYPTCNGTMSSGGCSCHTSTDDENDKVELPEAQDYEVPEEKQKDSFLPSSDLNDAFGRLKSKVAQKFGLEKLSNLLGGDLSGELPSWSFQIPSPIGGTVVLDLNKLLDYEFVSLFRCVLVFWVYYFTAITVFNSLRRLL